MLGDHHRDGREREQHGRGGDLHSQVLNQPADDRGACGQADDHAHQHVVDEQEDRPADGKRCQIVNTDRWVPAQGEGDRSAGGEGDHPLGGVEDDLDRRLAPDQVSHHRPQAQGDHPDRRAGQQHQRKREGIGGRKFPDGSAVADGDHQQLTDHDEAGEQGEGQQLTGRPMPVGGAGQAKQQPDPHGGDEPDVALELDGHRASVAHTPG